MSDQKLRVYRWTLGNGAVVGVRADRPTALLYGEELDLGSEHMPAVAGMEILRLAEENERLRKRLEAAEALLRRLGDTLQEEIHGQGGMARAELARLFLAVAP